MPARTGPQDAPDERSMWGVLRYVPSEPEDRRAGRPEPAARLARRARQHRHRRRQRRARAVTARIRLRQLGRCAVLLRRPGRGRARPGQHQHVLALEEALAAHAARGPPLARVLVERA